MPRIFPVEIISTQQCRKADEITIEAGCDSYNLMQCAGQAVAEEVADHTSSNKVLVLCGPGNNGGDGFVAAKLLKGNGWQVRLACTTTKDNLKGDAAKAADDWDGEIFSFEDIEPEEGETVIDAVFGTGYKGSLPEKIYTLFNKICEAELVVVAVDIPSGINGDTGAADKNTMAASITVTFFRKKPGHLLMPGMFLCGPTVVHDIGIPASTLQQTGLAAYENHPSIWKKYLKRKTCFDNKYTFGHAVILGGARMTGAALLAAHAALRVRSGMCTIIGPAETADIYRTYLPSLIFEQYEKMESFPEHLQDKKRNAALIGPGAGRDNPEELRQAVIGCCEMGEEKSLVLDADALTVFQGRREELFELLHDECVLTPHEGEFEKLFDDLEGIKPVRAIEAAALSGSVIVLKGADTLITTPDGRCIIGTNGPPSLATAGTGDVLAGMITGMLAQGIPAFEAACASSWILGEAAHIFGTGLISSDLPDLIPQVLKNLS